jgi:hypothetical protein
VIIRLLELPSTGRVVMANPSREREAQRVAYLEDVEFYLLRDVMPRSSVYVIDLDELSLP